MNTLPEIEKHAKDLMHKAVENAKRELASIRSGKATTALLDTVRVDAYGQLTPINQVASVAAPEPRLLTVQPWDKKLIGAIEKGIAQAALGLTPANDGTIIRIPLPPLTEERRKELVKVVRHKAEEGRVAVRNLRRAGRHELEALQKDGELSTDELERVEKDLEKITHDQVALIDQLLAHKEQELMAV